MLEPPGRIVSYKIFSKWGLDIIGPLPSYTSGKVYIMSVVEYVSQWLEARATRNATSKEMARFAFGQVVCRFGVLLELVADNVLEFRGDFVKGLVTHLEIAHKRATPYHPQCNGLVEAFNQTIQKLLFKLLDLYPRSWDKELNKALWACRMTHKLSTGFTPFHLVYGEDAMMPTNVLFPSIQMMECLGVHDEFQMDIQQEARYDLFSKRDEAIRFYEDLCQRRDKRSQALAREKNLIEGMLVLVYSKKIQA